jgi:XRE family transcriptional regulator, regulator of sulfur utilization
MVLGVATSPETMAFGKALREARVELNLSQEAAALACRVDRAYFGSLERAKQAPTITMLWRIGHGLGVRPSELLARAEDILEENAGQGSPVGRR